MAAGIPNYKNKSLSVIDPSLISGHRNSILISRHRIRNRTNFLNELAVMMKSEKSKREWHRFTVYNEELDMGEYPKHLILKAVTDFCYPDLLLPVYFVLKNKKAYFLARNCLDAIYRIIDEDMMIPNPWNLVHSFKINILANISNVDKIPVPQPEADILSVLDQSMLKGKILDLSKFFESPNLRQFCPLSQPKLLVYVLFLAEKLKPEGLILCHNDIRDFPPLDVLAKSNIRSIDLRHNLISDLTSIQSLNELKSLRDLYLDDNPLCDKYKDDADYFYSVKQIACKNLQKLDGKEMICNGLPLARTTFLCQNDGATLANNFLEYFFTAYDSRRINLQYLYGENAVFSLSYRIIRESVMPQGFQNATHYQYRRQNLVDQCLKHGRYTDYGKSAILKTIFNFPQTHHNPYTFSVDLMIKTTHFAILTVTGVFEETNVYQEETFSFSRTFVLNTKNQKTWTILNDQLHVYHPVVARHLLEIEHPPPPKGLTLPDDDMPSKEEKQDLIKAFQKLTGLSDTFCEDYLYKTMDRFDEALKLFVDDYENDVLPINAFKEHSDEDPSYTKENEFRGSLFDEYTTEQPVRKSEFVVLNDNADDTKTESIIPRPSVHTLDLPESSASKTKPVASVAPNRQAPIKMQIKPVQPEIKCVPAVFDLSGKAGSSNAANKGQSGSTKKRSRKSRKKNKKYQPPKPAELDAIVNKEMKKRNWYDYV